MHLSARLHERLGKQMHLCGFSRTVNALHYNKAGRRLSFGCHGYTSLPSRFPRGTAFIIAYFFPPVNTIFPIADKKCVQNVNIEKFSRILFTIKGMYAIIIV